MDRRFVKRPLARAWPACLCLFLALAVLSAVPGSGCGDTFVPQTTTGTEPPTEPQTTEETNPAPLNTFEFDLLPANADNALQTWVGWPTGRASIRRPDCPSRSP